MATRAVRRAHPLVLVLATGLFAAGCGRSSAAPPPMVPMPPPAPLPLITKDEVPPYCQFRGAVSSGQRSNVAYDDLQQQAAARGATHVVLDGTRAHGGGGWGWRWGSRIRSELFGRAFWCPPPPGYAAYAAPAPAAPPPAAGGWCNPACQFGYACVAGACTPVCDPPCAAGQVCATDRVCRPR